MQVVDVDPLKHVLLDEEPGYQGWQDWSTHMKPADAARLLFYVDCFRHLEDVSGDVVELGVFRGGNLKLLALASSVVEPSGGRNFVGFDTFGGFVRDQLEQPAEHAKAGVYDGADHLGAAVAKMAGMRLPVRFVVGDVVQTLPAFYESWGNRIALAYLDVDLLAPTRTALEVLTRQVSVGGRVLLDQYCRDGWSETQAVDEALAAHPGVFELRRLPNSRAPTAYLEKVAEP